MPEVKWIVRATPPNEEYPNGVPNQHVLVDLSPEDFRWYRHQHERACAAQELLDRDLFLTIIRETATIMDMHALLDARSIESGPPVRKGALSAPAAHTQDELFSPVDWSSPVGEAMQRAWEAQRERKGYRDVRSAEREQGGDLVDPF